MTRARELANFADNTSGLESLTVSDITDLTATATELNKLDGVTATTSELNVTDGVTVSTANINSAVNQITDSSTDLNVDSNTLVVDKSANAVGIGTTAPEHVLHIADVGANSFNTKAVFDLEGTRRSGYTQATLELAPASSGGTFRPYAIASELIGSQASSELVFYDNTTERMRINSSGNVGIGTGFNIDELLHAESGANTYVKIETTSDNGASGIQAKGTASNFYVYNQGSSDNLRIFEDSGCDINITPDGNLGIGTVPVSGNKLHVSGNTRIDGNIGLIGNSGTISPGNSGAGYMRIFGGGTNEGGAIEFRGGGNSGDLRFLTGTSGAGTERMRIQSDGILKLINSNYIDLQDAGTNYAYIGKGSSLTTGASATDLSIRFDGSNFYLSYDTTPRMQVTSDGHTYPGADNSQDLGSSSKRWRNIYTGDLHLSNEGSVNDVDGTSGNWTIQEGSEDLFIINNKSGKQYKIKMEEL